MYIAKYYGLAIDVGRQKLYYADAATGAGKVGELSTDGTAHRVLVTDEYSTPWEIVVDVDNRCVALEIRHYGSHQQFSKFLKWFFGLVGTAV